MAKAAFLEPGEADPPDLVAWLADWGFDPKRPFEERKDATGMRWFWQDDVV